MSLKCLNGCNTHTILIVNVLHVKEKLTFFSGQDSRK